MNLKTTGVVALIAFVLAVAAYQTGLDNTDLIEAGTNLTYITNNLTNNISNNITSYINTTNNITTNLTNNVTNNITTYVNETFDYYYNTTNNITSYVNTTNNITNNITQNVSTIGTWNLSTVDSYYGTQATHMEAPGNSPRFNFIDSNLYGYLALGGSKFPLNYSLTEGYDFNDSADNSYGVTRWRNGNIISTARSGLDGTTQFSQGYDSFVFEWGQLNATTFEYDHRIRIRTDIDPATNASYGLDLGGERIFNSPDLRALRNMSEIIVPTEGNVTSLEHGGEFNTLKSVYDYLWDAGVIEGGNITAATFTNNSGILTISRGLVAIYNNTNFSASNRSLIITSFNETNVTVDANKNYYIYVEYDTINKNVTVKSTESQSIIDEVTKVSAWDVYLEDADELQVIDVRFQIINPISKIQKVFYGISRFQHAQGGNMLGAPGGRNISVTAGQYFYGFNVINVSAFDTSQPLVEPYEFGQHHFEYYYRNSSASGNWSDIDLMQEINNTHYNAGSGFIALGNNKFRTDHVYYEVSTDLVNRSVPNHLAVVMGNTQYNTLAEAQKAPTPATLPSSLKNEGILIGRAIIQKGATSLASVDSVYDVTYSSSAATSHNGLASIQGGEFDQYYHFNLSLYNTLLGIPVLETATRLNDTWLFQNITAIQNNGTQYRLNDTWLFQNITSIQNNGTQYRLNDTWLFNNISSIQANGTEYRLNDTWLFQNISVLQANSTQFRLNDTWLFINISSIQVNGTEYRLNDTWFSQNISVLRGNDSELRLNDTWLFINQTALKENSTQFRLNDTWLFANQTALLSKDVQLSLNDTWIFSNISSLQGTDIELRLNDTWLFYNVSILQANSTEFRLNSTWIFTNISLLQATDTQLSLNDTWLFQNISSLQNDISNLQAVDIQHSLNDTWLFQNITSIQDINTRLSLNDTWLFFNISVLLSEDIEQSLNDTWIFSNLSGLQAEDIEQSLNDTWLAQNISSLQGTDTQHSLNDTWLFTNISDIQNDISSLQNEDVEHSLNDTWIFTNISNLQSEDIEQSLNDTWLFSNITTLTGIDNLLSLNDTWLFSNISSLLSRDIALSLNDTWLFQNISNLQGTDIQHSLNDTWIFTNISNLQAEDVEQSLNDTWLFTNVSSIQSDISNLQATDTQHSLNDTWIFSNISSLEAIDIQLRLNSTWLFSNISNLQAVDTQHSLNDTWLFSNVSALQAKDTQLSLNDTWIFSNISSLQATDTQHSLNDTWLFTNVSNLQSEDIEQSLNDTWLSLNITTFSANRNMNGYKLYNSDSNIAAESGRLQLNNFDHFNASFNTNFNWIGGAPVMYFSATPQMVRNASIGAFNISTPQGAMVMGLKNAVSGQTVDNGGGASFLFALQNFTQIYPTYVGRMNMVWEDNKLNKPKFGITLKTGEADQFANTNYYFEINQSTTSIKTANISAPNIEKNASAGGWAVCYNAATQQIYVRTGFTSC